MSVNRQDIIKAAMRIHPGVGFSLKRIVSAQEAILCDRKIPPGTSVGVDAWVLHENKYIFG
jgi:hypothetical protein